MQILNIHDEGLQVLALAIVGIGFKLGSKFVFSFNMFSVFCVYALSEFECYFQIIFHSNY